MSDSESDGYRSDATADGEAGKEAGKALDLIASV